MTDKEKQELRDLIIQAWDATAPCPDGNPFCPSCLFETFYQLLTESKTND